MYWTLHGLGLRWVEGFAGRKYLIMTQFLLRIGVYLGYVFHVLGGTDVYGWVFTVDQRMFIWTFWTSHPSSRSAIRNIIYTCILLPVSVCFWNRHVWDRRPGSLFSHDCLLDRHFCVSWWFQAYFSVLVRWFDCFCWRFFFLSDSQEVFITSLVCWFVDRLIWTSCCSMHFSLSPLAFLLDYIHCVSMTDSLRFWIVIEIRVIFWPKLFMINLSRTHNGVHCGPSTTVSLMRSNVRFSMTS